MRSLIVFKDYPSAAVINRIKVVHTEGDPSLRHHFTTFRASAPFGMTWLCLENWEERERFASGKSLPFLQYP
jgi:hypothetical protein